MDDIQDTMNRLESRGISQYKLNGANKLNDNILLAQ